MSERIYKLYNTEGHVSDELMLRYVSKQLLPAEEHSVERHCLDCELCGDTLEGLMHVQDKTQIIPIVKDLQQKVIAKSAGPKIVRMETRTWLSIAAGVALVVTIGYLFMNQVGEKKSEQAFKDNFTPMSPDAMDSVGALAEKDSSTDKKTLVADEPKLDQSPEVFKSISPDAIKQDEQILSKSTTTTSTDDITVTDENNGTFGYSAPPPPPPVEEAPKDIVKKEDGKYKNPVPIQDNKTTYEQNEKLKDEKKKYYTKGKEKQNNNESPNSTINNSQINQNSNNDGDKVVKQDAPSPKKQEDYLNGEMMDMEKEKNLLGNSLDSTVTNSNTSFMSDGLKKYDGKDYYGAQVQFEKEISVNPSNTKAVLYSAICALSLGDANKSILLLDKVLADTKGPYYETAQWYKALALIKQNEKKKARKLLEAIIKKGGGYKAKAEAALKDLK
jgi:hypothetical protein